MSIQSSFAVQPNMEVFTADAVRIGRVKNVRDNDMHIDRDSARDVFVPFSFVNQVIDSEHRVDLTITEAEYKDRAWEHPPLR